MRTLLHLLALGLTFILLSCSEQDERLKSSQLNSNFNFDTSKNYEEYIDYSRKIIKSARLDSNSHALELNSPFILHPSKKRTRSRSGQVKRSTLKKQLRNINRISKRILTNIKSRITLPQHGFKKP